MSNILSNPEEFEDEEFEDEDRNMYDSCPNCGRAYDEIDFEYQICHFCKFDANVNLFIASEILKDTDGNDAFAESTGGTLLIIIS